MTRNQGNKAAEHPAETLSSGPTAPCVRSGAQASGSWPSVVGERVAAGMVNALKGVLSL